MVIALTQPDFLWPDGRVQQGLGLGVDEASSDVDPAFGAFENDALLVLYIVGADDLDAVCIGVLDTEIAVHVPDPVLRIFCLSLDFNRAGVFGTHTPLGDVVVVCSPAGNHAGAVSGDTQPAGPVVILLWMDSLLGVGSPGRRAEPKVVIEIIRYRHRRLPAGARARAGADPAGGK